MGKNNLNATFEEIKKHGYYTKLGKIITVHTLDGKALRGKLTCIGMYEIFLVVKDKEENKQEITIFKNAIKYIN
ncbi:hypothetical protein DS832_08520 [Bombilactobacillus bombi]|uniref:Uncharacterized protein n=1 Tax=Bombilactobacillus bombi TaxID=1303590 RepID=A0A417Z3M1_9LACO|nr:hypothetical protein DS832_08520 [Bombilactobacillus bombi]